MTSRQTHRIGAAIADSIRQGEIITLDGGRVDTQEWVDLTAGLSELADDWVERDSGGAFREAEKVREYWCADDDGDNWRVHVIFRIK